MTVREHEHADDVHENTEVFSKASLGTNLLDLCPIQ